MSASPDSTLRVWHGTTLRPLGVLSVSERTGTSVNAIATLSPEVGKLAVASNDRVVSFYELHDHGGTQRWAVHGRMALVDMPLAVVGWSMPDGTQCFTRCHSATAPPLGQPRGCPRWH